MRDAPRLVKSLVFLAVAGWAAVITAPAGAQSPAAGAPVAAAAEGLKADFRCPPLAARPWAYWWWLKGNVSESSITRDLEAMRRQGFAGLLLFDARGYHEAHVPPPESRMEFMSPQWRRMVRFAMSEADRLGLRMSINLSSCAGALKGPWDVGDDAPKQLVFTAREVRGPARLDQRLPRPEAARFWDVALLAVRHDKAAADAEADSAKATSAAAASEEEALPAGWRTIRLPGEAAPRAVEVVDLSEKVDADGRLAWDVPEGSWTLLRFGCLPIAGHESDADILSAEAVERHFDRMGRALLADAGPLAGKVLTQFYSVSWEGAAPTWTLGFERQFRKYRGYDLRPYLPVLAGMTVASRDVSDRLLRDYHKTLSDLFMDNCYGKLGQLCRAAGLRWHSESGGPWNRGLPSFEHADQLAFLGRNDMPQGEFWFSGRAFNRPAAMAAHIYGRPLAATEAFTHMQGHWSAWPAALKPTADAAFCDGINQFIWHTFTASPPEFGKPGIEYFAGTHINPNVTWFEQAGPFLAYLARCQLMLRQGRFAADACCYTGDKPYLHWGRGQQWCKDPSLELGKGYAYDLLNSEVLDRAQIERGELVLPGGMRYRILVVDLEDDAARPEALGKIAELAEAGATVVLGRRRPATAPGLRGYPACDAEVRRLAEALWGPADQPAGSRPLGKGRVLTGTALDDALQAEHILPDFEGPYDYIHRRADGEDVYFVAGSGRADCTFRVQGRQPELWNPADGTVRDAAVWRATDDGRTVVPIDLPQDGSVFVVFRRPADPRHFVSIAAEGQAAEIGDRTEDGVRLRLWGPGPCVLETSEGRKRRVDAGPAAEPVALGGPWDVRFAPGRGAPESVVFDRLIPWNEHPDDGIKHFSGTATYRKTFALGADAPQRPVRLQLGEVRHVAQVRLNGTPLGIVWTAPWTVDLTGRVKAGENVLEIDVTNLWVNRLIGDAALPPEKRLTRTNIRLQAGKADFRPYQGYASEDPLERSGLLGPVRIELGSEQEVRF